MSNNQWVLLHGGGDFDESEAQRILCPEVATSSGVKRNLSNSFQSACSIDNQNIGTSKAGGTHTTSSCPS